MRQLKSMKYSKHCLFSWFLWPNC